MPRADRSPGSVLGKIVARKLADVATRAVERPLGSFCEALEPSTRSLEESLRQAGCGYILECKKASPSRGLLRANYDPAAIARAYAPIASGISVLCDAPFFQGSLDHLRAVRAAVDLPVLCKDFVVSSYQLYEAREAGADAILLMCSVLEPDELTRLHALAAELGLDALVEVHDAQELEEARSLGATLVGINNRNLETLAIDLSTTERLAPRVPAGTTLVSESGIHDHADVRRLRPLADGFLIGSALMAQPDPGRGAREIALGRVKVCGLTRPADARAAHAAGASYGGLIFAEKSKRRIDVEQARGVRAAAPALRWVGVFVDERPERVEQIAEDLDLAAVQLHGEEPAEQVAALRSAFAGQREVWKAVGVPENGGPLPRCAETGADRLLLDTAVRGQSGGSGQRFDWDRLREHPERGETILAGGLAPENAAEADELGAWALDVNSGVESAAGQKDAVRLEAFCAALRGVGRSSREEKA